MVEKENKSTVEKDRIRRENCWDHMHLMPWELSAFLVSSPMKFLQFRAFHFHLTGPITANFAFFYLAVKFIVWQVWVINLTKSVYTNESLIM